jgi:Terpene cyclase DEP1
MSHRSIMLLLVIVAFGALSALALQDVGYFGIIAPHFRSWGGAQVFADLTILAVLFCIWMVRDARSRGVAAWPFILLTVFLGSFGPLIYLVVRELHEPAGQKALV